MICFRVSRTRQVCTKLQLMCCCCCCCLLRYGKMLTN